MRTDAKEYSEYLEKKYLPGRRRYLYWLFYPKIMRGFPGNDRILDLGCGTGEFLNYCRIHGRDVVGIDSNETLVTKNRDAGFEVHLDDICTLNSLDKLRFKYAVCDNVLEHLESPQIQVFFHRVAQIISGGGILTCIVPGRRGFEKDPTHKTYVCPQVMAQLIDHHSWTTESYCRHPVNLEWLDKILYLNMQVFNIRRVPCRGVG
jgi:2-polyprenyl-3-methyl-5-hydroxy-6-metoxy-1,4-benzoquinol methylase